MTAQAVFSVPRSHCTSLDWSPPIPREQIWGLALSLAPSASNRTAGLHQGVLLLGALTMDRGKIGLGLLPV